MSLKLDTHANRFFNLRTILFMSFSIIIVAVLFNIANHCIPRTSATSSNGFRPGNIMSDAVMSNYGAMSKDDIQHFLTSKNDCSNRNHGQYLQLEAQYPNTDWHFEDGHFICLSEERFGDGMVIGSGQTAAEIIYQAAQDFRINPQVLLVLLEKEQSLVTDNFPNSNQYRIATGFGCPDTAACDTKYYGFKNQIRHAAKMFREVLDGGWSNYPAGRTSYVQYNPNSGCGGTSVLIENRATSALYRYTPYQPNASALNAGYGMGDACSAYGNRNFYLFFTDWFGDAQQPELSKAFSAIKNRYESLSQAEKQTLGDESGPMNCNIGHAGACVQAYQKGVIIYSPQTGAWENYGEIRNRFITLRSVDGKLGFPVDTVKTSRYVSSIIYQSFEHGNIYYDTKNNYTYEIMMENR